MEKKLITIIKMGVFIFLIWYSLSMVIKNQGSSEKIIGTWNYQTMFEIKIDDTFDIGMVVNKKEIVYHLFFFHPSSRIFYNQELEGHSLQETTKMILSTLIKKKILTASSSVEMVYYGDLLKDDFSHSVFEVLEEYNLSNTPIFTQTTLEERAKVLEIGSTSKTIILWGMEALSQDIVHSSEELPEVEKELTKDSAREYADNVYKKLEKLLQSTNLTDFTKNQPPFLLQTIPADSDGIYYPTNNSWYFANSGKITAYIEFTDKNTSYKFCYKGNIEKVSEEECYEKDIISQ